MCVGNPICSADGEQAEKAGSFGGNQRGGGSGGPGGGGGRGRGRGRGGKEKPTEKELRCVRDAEVGSCPGCVPARVCWLAWCFVLVICSDPFCAFVPYICRSPYTGMPNSASAASAEGWRISVMRGVAIELGSPCTAI